MKTKDSIFEVLRNITVGMLTSKIIRHEKELQVFSSDVLTKFIDMEITQRDLIRDFNSAFGEKITKPAKVIYLGLFDNLKYYN